MSALSDKLLSLAPKQITRLAYGVMASATTCNIEGSATAVTVPQMQSCGPLISGDYVAIQVVGADALIIGRVGVAVDAASAADASISITNATVTTIDGMSAVTDPNSWVSASAITVNRPGIYHCSMQVDWSGGFAVDDLCLAYIDSDDDTHFAHESRYAATSTPNQSLSGLVELSAGAYVRGLVYQNTGSSATAAITLAVVRMA